MHNNNLNQSALNEWIKVRHGNRCAMECSVQVLFHVG